MTCSVDVQKLAISPDVCLRDIFSHFSHQPWAMLLDTSGSNKSDGRYDIMVANPLVTYETSGAQTKVHELLSGSVKYSQEDPFELLDQGIGSLFAGTTPLSGAEMLPFLCGALGYFAYDLGRRIENLPETAKTEISSPDMAVGLYTWSVIKDNQTGECFLSHLTNHPAPSADELQHMANNAAPSQDFCLASDWQSNMTQQEYSYKLNRVLDYLKAGDCYQVNLAQRFSAAYTGDEWQAYRYLCDANQSPFSAFIRLDDTCVLSISPERFLSVNAGKVQTKPIKGTRPRAAEPELDNALVDELRGSEKDRAENLMIVDLLRNDISKACKPGSVKVPKLFDIETYAAVHHLVSTVEGELDENISPLQLLRGAFPGGSITGAPKVRAMQIIEELEPHRRHVYCGSIGYIGIREDMDTSICIRTVMTQNGHMHCWAGGGIVVDSDPDSEYQESLDKVSKILPTLNEHRG